MSHLTGEDELKSCLGTPSSSVCPAAKAESTLTLVLTQIFTEFPRRICGTVYETHNWVLPLPPSIASPQSPREFALVSLKEILVKYT